MLTRVNDSCFIIIKGFELFLPGKSEYWNAKKRCFNQM